MKGQEMVILGFQFVQEVDQRCLCLKYHRETIIKDSRSLQFVKGSVDLVLKFHLCVCNLLGRILGCVCTYKGQIALVST